VDTPRPGSTRSRARRVGIRAATPADCVAIAGLAQEVGGREVARSLERCRRETTDPDVLLLMAEADTGPVGFGRAAAWVPPPDAPANAAPAGWYLLGLFVRPAWRRRGVGRELTRERLRWLAERTRRGYFFANARNEASIALHESLGFAERTRDFWFPNTSFDGGEGVLFEADLEAWRS
jgi:ribosomal protein S18 acetylase RimI-like enzyme